jgi:phosphoglycerol transferase
MIYFYAILVGFFFKNLCIIKNKIGFWLLIIFIGLTTFLYISVDAITDEGFNRAFWYHINNNLFSGSYKPYLKIFLLNLIFFCISFFLGFIIRSNFSFSGLNLSSNYHLTLIVLIIIINPGILSLTKSFINTSITDVKIENLDFKSHFNQINNLPDKFENKDLIFITAESLERTFYTNPELKKLKLSLTNRNDIYDFSNIIEVDEYTSWTIAGIVANNCGIPIIDSRFYSGFNCLSDLLAKKNYDLLSIQGSSENFAGNGNFYKIHNIKNVIGFDRIIKENKGAEKSQWGVYDNLLLNYSKNKILNLEKKK